MQKNNEIISNFYLIRENSRPTYIGYTNRLVKQRFREHIKEKDFTGDATVEGLDSLSFPFTWDINTINQYAQEVSDRETSLIAEYGTGDSVWQKGINGNLGGQTWNDIKHFINTNRDNPKFASVEESDVVELIAYQKKVKHDLQNVIDNTIPRDTQQLKDVIKHTIPKETQRLKDVIGSTKHKEHIKLQNVIDNTMPSETRRLKSVIGNTTPKETQRLKDAIGTTKHKEHIRLKNVIGTTKNKEHIRLNNVIGTTKNKEHIRLNNVIRHTIPIEVKRLRNVIINTQPAEHKKL